MTGPILYLDLGSPYAYLAVERVESVLGRRVELEPVLLGAMFKLRGWGSWADTDARGEGIAEVEARADRYGLPSLVWPERWPANSLAASRAAVWAKTRGLAGGFITALYRLQFAHGADITSLDVLSEAARQAGLNPDELPAAIERPEIKQRLREATDDAWERGVRGVPSLGVGGAIFYGDDKLEDAASTESLRPSRPAGVPAPGGR